MKNALFFLFTTLLLTSCDKAFKDDELTMDKKPYLGNELKLNGYYYDINPNTNGIGEAVLLYRDGTMLFCGGSGEEENPFDFIDNLLASSDFINHAQAHKFYWGVFQINDTQLQYERWYQSDGGLPVGHSEGTILNDSTFIVDDEVFHFRYYTPKPDSLNDFIH